MLQEKELHQVHLNETKIIVKKQHKNNANLIMK